MYSHGSWIVGQRKPLTNIILFAFQAETAQAGLRPDQQATKQITVHPYTPFDQNQKNFLYISTGTNRVSVGETLSLQFSLSLTDQTNREHIKYLTYLVRPEHVLTLTIVSHPPGY